MNNLEDETLFQEIDNLYLNLSNADANLTL